MNGIVTTLGYGARSSKEVLLANSAIDSGTFIVPCASSRAFLTLLLARHGDGAMVFQGSAFRNEWGASLKSDMC